MSNNGLFILQGWFSLSSFLAANATAEMDERPTLYQPASNYEQMTITICTTIHTI